MLKKTSLFIFCFLFFSFLYAQNPESFQVPEPPGGRLMDTKNFSLDAQHPIENFLYSSTFDSQPIADFYLNYFAKFEFKKTIDNLDAKNKRHALRFKKDQEVVNVLITAKPPNTEIIVSKYRQLPGEPEIEKLKPSVRNPLFALPKEDVAGIDLPEIPRPPGSIRMMGKDMGGTIFLLYTTTASVEGAADFFKSKMPAKGWSLESDIAAQDAIDAYKRETKKKTLGISTPFSDGEDFEQLVMDSRVLAFKGPEGEAKIIIFPNYTDRKLGAMAQVTLRKQK